MSLTSQENPIQQPLMGPDSPLGYSSATPHGNYTPASPGLGEESQELASPQEEVPECPDSPPKEDTPSSPPPDDPSSPQPEALFIDDSPESASPPEEVPGTSNSNIPGNSGSPPAGSEDSPSRLGLSVSPFLRSGTPQATSPLKENLVSSPPSHGNESPESSLSQGTPASPLIEDTPPASPVNDDTPPASPIENNQPPNDDPENPDAPGSPIDQDTPESEVDLDTPGSPDEEVHISIDASNTSSSNMRNTPSSPAACNSPSSPPPETMIGSQESVETMETEGTMSCHESSQSISTSQDTQERLIDSPERERTSDIKNDCLSPIPKPMKEPEIIELADEDDGEKMDVDPEDLEEGEIEDDEEPDEVEIISKSEKKDDGRKSEKVSSFAKIFGGDKENQKKEKKEKEEKKSSRRKDKESGHSQKESSKSKEKENKSKDKKKRKHSETNGTTSEDELKKTKSPVREKRSRKTSDNSDANLSGPSMGPEDDEDEAYLFVRGGSPQPNLSKQQMALQNFAYGDEDFGGMMYDQESDEEGRGGRGPRGRRDRSPNNRRRRQDRDEGRGGRRGGGRNKDDLLNKNAKSDIICAYYMQGKCQKTHEECNFSHNAVPPRKMELCKFWMMDCCAKREKCLYLHNDFPCKFYHTGLVCKQGERCKFSHKPLNDITKAVLLKHIETAPKEILGDFPRLNRNGALNLINKMESKILGALAEEKAKEKEHEAPRRTRWEQPTRDDQEKLQELMEEAGIGGFYRETLEGPAPAAPTITQPPPAISKMLGANPFTLPPPQAPLIPQPTPVLVQNAALANVLATLNIPSSTIQPIIPTPTLEETKAALKPPQISPASSQSQPSQGEETENPYWNSKTAAGANDSVNLMSDPPEHLPPMQRELFLRIQQQQLKNANKTAKEDSDDDEKPDDVGWYSSEEEDEGEKRVNSTSASASSKDSQSPAKAMSSMVQNQPPIDISSVISSLRKSVEPKPKSALSPSGRGDIDLRNAGLSQSSGVGNAMQPFGDTDFRLPVLRPDLRDIDLRLTSSPPGHSMEQANPLNFFKLPSGPATEIDASINSHPPVQYQMKLVLGVDKPDYRYIRHTMTPSQILLDPRLGPRAGSSTMINIPDPASPPPASHPMMTMTPTTIPVGDNMLLDPRVRRSAAQALSQAQNNPLLGHHSNSQMQIPQSAMPGLLGDPRFPRDPRSIQIGPPGGWPPSDEYSQAQAAMIMSAQQSMGIPPLFPFPNPGGFQRFMGSNDFNSMGGQGGGGQGRMGHLNQGQRSQFGGGHRGGGRGRPAASSWERYSQQQHDPDGSGLTP